MDGKFAGGYKNDKNSAEGGVATASIIMEQISTILIHMNRTDLLNYITGSRNTPFILKNYILYNCFTKNIV